MLIGIFSDYKSNTVWEKLQKIIKRKVEALFLRGSLGHEESTERFSSTRPSPTSIKRWKGNIFKGGSHSQGFKTEMEIYWAPNYAAWPRDTEQVWPTGWGNSEPKGQESFLVPQVEENPNDRKCQEKETGGSGLRQQPSPGRW